MYTKVISKYEDPKTGKIIEQTEFQTAAVLKTIGRWHGPSPTNPNGNVNTNGKKFIINNVEIELPNGRTVQRTALCYEGNYDPAMRKNKEYTEPLAVGQSYLTTLRFDEQLKPQLQMSHLTNANRATADDFAELYAAAGLNIKDVVRTDMSGNVIDQSSQKEAEKQGAPAETES